MKRNILLTGAALAALCLSSVQAAKLGDAAAPLVIKDWIKGEKVDVRDGKNIYVVEFWATWCPPCRTSIPHLTEVQKKFKDKGVVIVGVSDEPKDTVAPFVKDMGDKMDYTVACDDNRQTFAAYMRAYNQNGIPTAFIIGKDGKVLWYGHPMTLEEPLSEVVAGKYDLAKAIKREQFQTALDEYSQKVAQGDPTAAATGQNLLKQAGDDVESLTDVAFTVAAGPGGEKRDFALAHRALDKAEQIAGKDNARLTGIRSIVLFESGKHQEGMAMAKKAVELAKTDSEKQIYQRFLQVMEYRLQQQQKPQAAPQGGQQ
ncbi:MAG: hypothetical protein D6766_06045 [Verrucomicrobia bacterium]|nr:MAG: hypothetical protein D6766_06045 [Verrucomicrobiota bacterium]